MLWERVDICSIWSACGKRLARNADLPMLLDGGEANSSLSLSLQLLTRKRCVERRIHDAGNTHAGWWVSSKKAPNPSRARSRVP